MKLPESVEDRQRGDDGHNQARIAVQGKWRDSICRQGSDRRMKRGDDAGVQCEKRRRRLSGKFRSGATAQAVSMHP